MKKIIILFLILFLLFSINTLTKRLEAKQYQDDFFINLFKDVKTLSFTGLPGILSVYDNAEPLVMSSDNSVPKNQIAIAGVKYGKGYILGFCHDSFFSDPNFDNFDNKIFTKNIFERSIKSKISISISHGEWFNKSNSTKFINFAKNFNFDIEFIDNEIDENKLKDTGIFISGSASICFTETEINAIHNFINNGGVALILSLGWSWVSYHSEKTLDELPANQLVSKFGIYWNDGIIHESLDNLTIDCTKFSIFYPSTLNYIFNFKSAINNIEQTLKNTSNLNEYLNSSKDVRNKFINSLEFLYKNFKIINESKRQEIFNTLLNIVDLYPYYFKKDHSFDEKTQNILCWIREKFTILIYCFGEPLNKEKKIVVQEKLNLKDYYKNFWDKFNILILDNNKLYKKNLEYMYTFFDSLPISKHNIKLIMIGTLLGKPIDGLYLLYEDEKKLIYNLGAAFATSTNLGYAIDLWDLSIDGPSENPFPNDIYERKDPYFAGALSHETTHIIDMNLVLSNENLSKQRNILLNRAGKNNLNFLRSMFEQDFFIKNPGEFIASIGNQWFCDTWNTLDLAIKRFNNGYKEPINQFLFFAKILSTNNEVPFYNRGLNGTKLNKIDVHVSTNKYGNINRLYDSKNKIIYYFDLEENMFVKKITQKKISDDFKKYKINFINSIGGKTEPSGTIIVYEDEELNFNIIPDLGYKIKDVLIDNLSIGAVSSYSLENINNDHTIEVLFEPLTFTINSKVELGGTINPLGKIKLNYGETQTFTIIPDKGYKITDVLADGVSVGAVSAYTFENVSGDHTIEAIFEPLTFTITASAGTGGTISPSGKVVVKYGESKRFTITPDKGYKIKDVLVDGKSVGGVSVYTFENIDSDHSIEVIFETQTFTINSSSSVGGTIEPFGKTVVKYGESKTFKIIPDKGYKIKDVLVDGKSVGAVSSYTFKDIDSDHKIEVIFEKEKIVIILQIGNKLMFVNYREQEIDVPPQIIEGRTLLPIKYIVEPLGGEISWDSVERKVTILFKDKLIELWIGKNIAKVNGVNTPIDPNNPKVVPMIIQGRTMLPVRFVAENLGCKVDWDVATKTVTITYPGE